jgi:hypothetical protein
MPGETPPKPGSAGTTAPRGTLYVRNGRGRGGLGRSQAGSDGWGQAGRGQAGWTAARDGLGRAGRGVLAEILPGRGPANRPG